VSDAKRTDVRSRRETRGTRRRDRAIAREAAAPVRQDVFEVGEEGLPVMELATTLAVTPSEVVKILFMKGIMVQVNQVGAAVDQTSFVLSCALIWSAPLP
jgi:translation initiation factor IF-2